MVEMIKDSAPVDRSKLDPNKVPQISLLIVALFVVTREI